MGEEYTMNIEYKEKLKTLALHKVEQIVHSLEKQKQLEVGHRIREFFTQFITDHVLLEDLYKAYKKKVSKVNLNSHQTTISYTHDTLHTITFFDKQFSLDEETYVRLLTSCIEIMREVLPLGSVVELDPTYFKPGRDTSSSSKIVITGRYIAPQNYTSYFPYAGVVYPIGEMKPGTQIYFTAPLIKKIVHQGYKDDMEEAFELLIKEEFIVEKDMKSIEFSGSEMRKLQRELEEQKVGDS